MAKEESNARCVKLFALKANSGSAFLQNLRTMTIYNWSPIWEEANFEPETLESVKKLEKLMEKLKASTGGHRFAFERYGASEVWLKGIYVAREFKFLKKGSDRVGQETKSMLTFEQFLPFNNKNHDNKDCVAIKDLPMFYKKKGN